MAWQAITCEATFTADGRPQVQAMTWDGARLPVVDTGRRWTESDGRHLLARVADGRVFELRYNGADWAARLSSQPPSFI